jgi:hypothetical protein
MEQPAMAPQYVVLHDSISGVFKRGDIVPPGTYDEEQLARLVGLGAIEPYDPPAMEFRDKVDPSVEPNAPAAGSPPLSPASQVPQSAEEFKARQEAAALEAAGTAPDALVDVDLSDEQRANLRAAGFGSWAAIDAATDEQLLEVEGVGPAAVKRLREAPRG